MRLLIALLWLLVPGVVRAQEALVASLSQAAVGVSTGFTGAELLVFGATEAPIGPGGDEVVITVRGPARPLLVRRKRRLLGLLWVNGPAARFGLVPGFYAVSGTRPAWQILPEDLRGAYGLGLETLPLQSTGARAPAFRAAALELKIAAGLWLEDVEPVAVEGARLFHLRVPLPASVPTGDYVVEVFLVRSRAIAERRMLSLRVDRVGTADRIATVAEDWPLVYGVGCVLLAAAAGWGGSVLFRRG